MWREDEVKRICLLVLLLSSCGREAVVSTAFAGEEAACTVCGPAGPVMVVDGVVATTFVGFELGEWSKCVTNSWQVDEFRSITVQAPGSERSLEMLHGAAGAGFVHVETPGRSSLVVDTRHGARVRVVHFIHSPGGAAAPCPDIAVTIAGFRDR